MKKLASLVVDVIVDVKTAAEITAEKEAAYQRGWNDAHQAADDYLRDVLGSHLTADLLAKKLGTPKPDVTDLTPREMAAYRALCWQ